MRGTGGRIFVLTLAGMLLNARAQRLAASLLVGQSLRNLTVKVLNNHCASKRRGAGHDLSFVRVRGRATYTKH